MVAFYVPIGLMDAPKPIVVSFLGSASDTSGGNFNLSFGAADPNRYLVAMVGSGDGSVAVTIGGVTATPLVQQQYNGSAAGATGIYLAKVPTGTSGTVTITNANANRAVGLYSLINLQSVSAVATSSASAFTTPKPLPLNINIQAGGVVLTVTYSSGSGSSPSATWTGLTPDANFSFTNLSFAGVFSCGNIQSPVPATKNMTVTVAGTETCCAVSLR